MKIAKKYIHQSGHAKNKINQTLLQTGKPKGTFSKSDKHPNVKSFFYKMFCPKTKKENWVHQSSIFFVNFIKPKLDKKKRRNPQTIKALRTNGKIKFSCGDQHPKLKNYYFSGYDKGKESWETKETRKNRLQKKKNSKNKIKASEYNKLRWKKLKNDPEFLRKKAIRDKKYSKKPENKKRRNKVLKVWLSNPHTKAAHTLRNRINNTLKNYSKRKKYASTTKLLGITIPEFIKYFESKFTKGMSWDNHGKWHIDHITPCANFNLTDPKEQKKCFHYTNLQPLWAHDNLSKGAKLNWQKAA